MARTNKEVLEIYLDAGASLKDTKELTNALSTVEKAASKAGATITKSFNAVVKSAKRVLASFDEIERLEFPKGSGGSGKKGSGSTADELTKWEAKQAWLDSIAVSVDQAKSKLKELCETKVVIATPDIGAIAATLDNVKAKFQGLSTAGQVAIKVKEPDISGVEASVTAAGGRLRSLAGVGSSVQIYYNAPDIRPISTAVDQAKAKLQELGSVDISPKNLAKSSLLGNIDATVENAKSKVQELNTSIGAVNTVPIETAFNRIEGTLSRLSGIGITLVANLLQPLANFNLNNLTTALQDATKEIQNLMQQLADQQAAKKWSDGISSVIGGAGVLVTGISTILTAKQMDLDIGAKIMGGLGTVRDKFGELSGVLSKDGKSILDFFGSAGSTIGAAIPKITAAFSALNLSTGWVVAGIIAIITVIGLLIAYWDDIYNYFDSWIKAAEDAGMSWVDGVFMGILASLVNLGTWISQNLFEPFMKWFCSLFGIHSPSTVMAEQGGYIAEGLFNGITNSDIGGFFRKILEGVIKIFSSAWDSITRAASLVWSNITRAASLAWNGIMLVWNAVTGYFQNIWDTVAGIFSAVQSVLAGDFEGAWTAIQGIFQGWGEYFAGLWEDLTGVFADAWDFFTGIGGNVVDGLMAGINNAWSGLTSWFDGIWNSLFGNRTATVTVNKKTTSSGGGRNASALYSAPAGGAAIPLPPVPQLARGAVLPANQPFLALVGEQRSGTNVEAPLSTIQEALALALEDMEGRGSANQQATLEVLRQILQAVLGIQIGDETIGRAARRYERRMAVVNGGML